MINEIPHDMSYTISRDLRESPNNLEEYKKGIQYLEKRLTQLSTTKEKAKCLSALGVLNRVVGKLKVSLHQLNEADNLLDECKNERLKLVNRIRIAQTLQFQGEHKEAERIHVDLEGYIKNHPEYSGILDFIYQHKGKNYYEQNHLQKALNAIEAALQIRLKKNKSDLIESSQFAIDIIKEEIR